MEDVRSLASIFDEHLELTATVAAEGLASLGLVPGELIDGRYQVERVVAVGGMGTIVAARHVGMDRRVALKILHVDPVRHEGVRARFEREAKISAMMESEHVVRVFHVGRTARGEPYMAMELLEGTDLEVCVRDRGPLSVTFACTVMVQACEALAEAHVRGIVHRDLKPANLFVVPDPAGLVVVKVLDFGISKRTSTFDPKLTAAGALVGSPLYMSPEQVFDPGVVDARSDLWALGVTLYELLTGAPPFTAATLSELFASIAGDTPPQLRSMRRDVSPELARIVARALAKNPADRFASAGELATALSDFAAPEARRVAARAVRIERAHGAPSSEPPSAGERPSRPPTSSAPPRPRERPKRRARAILGLVLTAGVACAALYAFQPAPRAPSPTAEGGR